MPDYEYRPSMERITRIHRLILAGDAPNCRQLQEQFEASRSTVLRDIRFMKDRLKLPIVSVGRYGGYQYEGQVAALPGMQVDEAQILALCAAEQSLVAHLGTPLESSMRSVVQQMKAALDEKVQFAWAEMASILSFRPVAVAPLLDPKLFPLMVRAIRQQREVTLQYRQLGSGGAINPRVLRPHHLLYATGAWYLMANTPERDRIHTYALCRMQKPRLTKRTFTRLPDFDPDALLADCIGLFSGDDPSLVRLRVTAKAADWILERIWHPSQEYKRQPNGEVEMQMRVCLTPELENWVLQWGPHVEVLGPVELRQRIRQLIIEMGSLY